jgi:hypothetical protein
LAPPRAVQKSGISGHITEGGPGQLFDPKRSSTSSKSRSAATLLRDDVLWFGRSWFYAKSVSCRPASKEILYVTLQKLMWMFSFTKVSDASAS